MFRVRTLFKSLVLIAPLFWASSLTAKAEALYRSSLGTQLSKDCFSVFKKRNLRDEEADESRVLRGFDRLVTDALKRVQACGQKYPELSSYLVEWRRQLRRSIVRCEDKDLLKGEADYWAYATESDGPHPLVVIPFDVVGHFGQKETTFWANGQYNWDGLVDLMIHEVLHHTSANNLAASDHNRIERIKPGSQGRCADDATTDRISVIASLCSGQNLNSSKRPAVLEISDRARRCPGSCQKLFTATQDIGMLERLFSGRLRSQGLPPSKAGPLCAKIRDDATCTDALKTHASDIDAREPHLSALSSPLRERLSQVLPARYGEIPRELIRSFAELEQGYQAIKSTKCFQSALRPVTRAGREALEPVEEGIMRRREVPLDYWTHNDVSFAVQDVADRFAKQPLSAAGCASQPDKNAVLAWISRLASRMTTVEHDAFYLLRASIARANGRGEDNIFCGMCPKVPRSPELLQFYGPELLDNYIAAVKRYHTSSPQFSCEEAGLSPFRAAQRAKEVRSLTRSTTENDSSCYEQ